MWAQSRDKYHLVISIIIITMLLIPTTIEFNGFFMCDTHTSKYDDTEILDTIKPDELEENSPSNPRGTRSSEAEYLSSVDYSDVLIVRNNNSAISMEIADYFKVKRNIPDINVCNITTSTSQTITRTTFEDEIRTPIENYIISNGLLGTINYIVTTKGVPLRISEVDTSDDDINWPNTYDRASVDSELTIILGSYSGYIGEEGPMMPLPPPSLMYIQNPYYNSYDEFSQSDYGIFLVTRLTGYNITQIKTYIDRVPEAVGKKGTFVFDEEPNRGTMGNDWMQNANATLTAKGFNVIHNDQTNTFLTNNENVSGYTSWGSNDGSWYAGVNTNYGFETDSNGDDIPDDWFVESDIDNDQIDRNNTDKRYGSWSLRIERDVANSNFSAISQNFSIKPDTRYFLRGQVNVSSVSSDKGAHLRIRAYDGFDQLVWEKNGSVRTGTTSNWVSLGQILYEPIDYVTKIMVSAVLSESSGEAYFDDIRLIEIRPHNSWLDGALVETYVSTSGRTFNYPASYGQSLAADLILDGVSGTKAYVYEPYLSACAHPDILFDAYTDGFFSAESYFMASEFLSWMDVVVCDPKLAVYKQSMIPDLAISPNNISFSNDQPKPGEEIEIYANVTNLGNYTASDVVIRFYVGDPQSGGTLIGENVLDVAAHSQNQTSISWNTTGFIGALDIYIYVDAIDRYYELREDNNIASTLITVADKFDILLEPGWNLISLPLIQMNTSLEAVLDSISGDYDNVQIYNADDVGVPWKLHHISKPLNMVDLYDLNHTMGVWIYITNPAGAKFVVNGLLPNTSIGITLYPGWNLVGYPSQNDYQRNIGLNNTFFGTDVDAIWTYNASAGQWMEMGASDRFERGKGYWIFSLAEINWQVPV